MRLFIDQHVGKISGQRLRDGNVGRVTVREQDGIRRGKKGGQTSFEPFAEPMIAGGDARRRDREAVLAQAGAQRGDHRRMTGQPQIIAPAEIGKLTIAIQYVGAIDLLEGRHVHDCRAY